MATNESKPAVRPVFVVAGVAILAAVLSFVVVNAVFLGGDGGGEDVTTQPRDRAEAPPEPVATPEPVAETREDVGLGQGRDPFRAAFGTAPVPEVGAAAAAGTPEPDPAGTPVEVQSVVEDNSFARIVVGAVTYERAQVGDALAAGIQVASIEDRCVTFSRDDQSFTLCQGESGVL